MPPDGGVGTARIQSGGVGPSSWRGWQPGVLSEDIITTHRDPAMQPPHIGPGSLGPPPGVNTRGQAAACLEVVDVEVTELPPMAFFKIGVGPSPGIVTHHVMKNFADLQNLHESLARELRTHVPALPPSRSTAELAGVAYRGQLGAHLGVLSRIPEIASAYCFRNFFQLSDEYRRSDAASGQRNQAIVSASPPGAPAVCVPTAAPPPIHAATPASLLAAQPAACSPFHHERRRSAPSGYTEPQSPRSQPQQLPFAQPFGVPSPNDIGFGLPRADPLPHRLSSAEVSHRHDVTHPPRGPVVASLQDGAAVTTASAATSVRTSADNVRQALNRALVALQSASADHAPGVPFGDRAYVMNSMPAQPYACGGIAGRSLQFPVGATRPAGSLGPMPAELLVPGGPPRPDTARRRPANLHLAEFASVSAPPLADSPPGSPTSVPSPPPKPDESQKPTKSGKTRSRSRPQCVVCMAQPQEMAIDPCGHLSMCHVCVQAVRTCPVCRGPISKALRIFIA